MSTLLDVNVLIALLDENHINHLLVSEWLTRHIEQGWASCPLTQNGCVRILSGAKYPNRLPIADAIERLRTAVSTIYHQFIADDISLLDHSVVNGGILAGPSQITDVYLLALAVSHGGRFVTLDRHVPLSSVRGACEESLVVIQRVVDAEV